MFDFVGRRNWYYLLSFLVLLPGMISLAIPPSLKPGIEFTGGDHVHRPLRAGRGAG